MTLRRRLLAGDTVYGAWSTLPGPAAVAALVVPGLDFVVLDLQHGSASEHDLPALTSAAVAAGAAPLARLRSSTPSDVGRALDLGAHGVILPTVDTPQHAAEVAAACHLPPRGSRSAGRVLGGTDEPLCLVMVETAPALAAVDAIVAVPGVDAVYVGPYDLSLAIGGRPSPDDPVTRPALERIWAACAGAGKPVGVYAQDGATARRYRKAGCRIVTVLADVPAHRAATADAVTTARPAGAVAQPGGAPERLR